MIEILEETAGKLLACRVKGSHIRDDSHELAALLDARIGTYGTARCLIELVEIEGVEPSALREGLDFDLHHGNQIERCAIVGDRPWERWLTRILKIFFRRAEVRFFEADRGDEAREWVREGL